ncbi:MAG: Pyridoxal kinase [Devosia sp.]|uniref:pyridoxal kinase n=1 Tax=Devosia sp. TaxID=1871048 RepID=UPI00262153BE|nr:pyridoxal kinase [Devosia sp.]MDB5529586.1 Pyridoxal kinase [Devosia sp.]
MSVISIQSQVIHGHVGNSAAVFPLQLAGFEVAAVPTVLLSNHPAYPSVKGRVMDAGLVADLLAGLEDRGLLESTRVLMTGYIGSAEIAAVVVDFVTRAKARNAGLLYVCDPVMGDFGPGFYVKAEVREAIIGQLVPLADILTPNRFEFDALVGRASPDTSALVAAAQALGKRVMLVTGSPAEQSIETIAVERAAAWRVATPALVTKASGTGDLLTALFVAATLKGRATPDALADAVSGVFAIIEATVAQDGLELDLVRQSARLFTPPRRFASGPVSGGVRGI